MRSAIDASSFGGTSVAACPPATREPLGFVLAPLGPGEYLDPEAAAAGAAAVASQGKK